MAQGIQEPEHVWLVMMKAMRALTRYAAAGIEETGLGLSDFGVLEALLHKGPLPVNTIGPIVDLTPGSISIAVDRLFEKGLVTRVESSRRPARSNRRTHPTRQGSHCFRLSKAFRANEKSVLRTEPGGASRARKGAEKSRQEGCRADGAELNGPLSTGEQRCGAGPVDARRGCGEACAPGGSGARKRGREVAASHCVNSVRGCGIHS